MIGPQRFPLGASTSRWVIRALAGPLAVLVVTILVLVGVELGTGNRSPALGGRGPTASDRALIGGDSLDATRRVTMLRSLLTFDDGRSARLTVTATGAETQALAQAEVIEFDFGHNVAGSGAVFDVAVTGGSRTTTEGRSSSPGTDRVKIDLRPLFGGFGVTSFELVITSSVPSASGQLLQAGSEAALVSIGGPSTESFSSLVLLEHVDACLETNRIEAALALDAVFAPTGDLAFPGGYTPLALCWDPTAGSSLWRTRAAVGSNVLRDPAALRYLDSNRTGAAGGAFYSYRIAGGTVFVLSGACDVLVCGVDSPQQRWFDESTAALTSGCAVAYWSDELDPDLERLVISRTDLAVPGTFVATDAVSETRIEISDGSIRWSRSSIGPVSSGTTNCRRGS